MNRLCMKITVNPSYAGYAGFVDRIPEIFEQQGKTIYKARNEIKVFESAGRLVNVKQFKVPFFLQRIVYSCFRAPKAVRAYENAQTLLSKGIETPRPIGYIVSRRGGLLHCSYFVSFQTEGEPLYDLGMQPTEKNADVFIALGRYVAGLHAAGVWHADLSPGNILYRRAGGEIRFCLLDINRMSFGPVSVGKGCANFARLWGKEAGFRLMAEAYATARGADPATCVRQVLESRNRFWKKYLRKHTVDFEL